MTHSIGSALQLPRDVVGAALALRGRAAAATETVAAGAASRGNDVTLKVGLGVIVRLAVATDDVAIATLARDEIEQGFGWTWTAARIAASRQASDMNLAVACRDGRRLGFGLMRYFDDSAHLCLLAVDPRERRQGVGSVLLRWLESSALTAGIGATTLEMRATNGGARIFYERHGYRCVGTTPGYYQGREDALRLRHPLIASV